MELGASDGTARCCAGLQGECMAPGWLGLKEYWTLWWFALYPTKFGRVMTEWMCTLWSGMVIQMTISVLNRRLSIPWILLAITPFHCDRGQQYSNWWVRASIFYDQPSEWGRRKQSRILHWDDEYYLVILGLEVVFCCQLHSDAFTRKERSSTVFGKEMEHPDTGWVIQMASCEDSGIFDCMLLRRSCHFS